MKITVGNKELTIRKWKGKDKKKIVKALSAGTDDDQFTILNALVYDSIEEDVTLSTDEFKYVLSRIRAISIGEGVDIEFYCDSCGNNFDRHFELKDIIRYSYTELSEINVPGAKIKLGEIKNKKYYVEKVVQDDIYDLLLRVEEINGNSAFTLDTLEEFFDDLDLDVLTEIVQIFEDSKFTVDDVNEVTCKCGKVQQYQFDEIPGFIPESWVI